MSIWSAVLGGAHLVYHGAGWMEGGLTASFEKIVLDVEMLQMIAAHDRAGGGRRGRGARRASPRSPTCRPAVTSSARRTRSSATRAPSTSRSSRTGRTTRAGRTRARGPAEERATAVWQEALERYEQPPLDEEVAARLDEYVTPAARRARAGGGGSREDPLRPQRARGRSDARSASPPTRPTASGSTRSPAARSRAFPTRPPTGSTPTSLVLSGSTDPWAAHDRGRARASPRASACSSTGPCSASAPGCRTSSARSAARSGRRRRRRTASRPSRSSTAPTCSAAAAPRSTVRKRHDDEVKRLPVGFPAARDEPDVPGRGGRGPRPALVGHAVPSRGVGRRAPGRPARPGAIPRAGGSPSVNHGTAALARGLAVLEALADADDGRDAPGVVQLAELVGGEKSQLSRTLRDARGARLGRARPGDARLPARLARLRPRRPRGRPAPRSTQPGRCCASSWRSSARASTSPCARATWC